MTIKKVLGLVRNSKGQSVSMKGRLLMYMFVLLLIALGLIGAALVITGVIDIDDDRLYESMSMRLDSEENLLAEEKEMLEKL